jgi:hypothetical protein
MWFTAGDIYKAMARAMAVPLVWILYNMLIVATILKVWL